MFCKIQMFFSNFVLVLSHITNKIKSFLIFLNKIGSEIKNTKIFKIFTKYYVVVAYYILVYGVIHNPESVSFRENKYQYIQTNIVFLFTYPSIPVIIFWRNYLKHKSFREFYKYFLKPIAFIYLFTIIYIYILNFLRYIFNIILIFFNLFFSNIDFGFVFEQFILLLLFFVIFFLLLYIIKFFYFKSKIFTSKKEKVLDFIKEYNDINKYLSSISNTTDFSADTKNYKYTHLADYENTSKGKIKRDKHKSNLHCKYTYNTSLQVVKNASQKPIEYLCKYFNIKETNQNLEKLEEIGQNIDRFNNTLDNLQKRREELTRIFKPPLIIKIFFHKEFLKRLDIEIPEIKMEYPKYIFEYVSVSGNSSQRTVIKFDNETIEATAKYIAEKIRFKMDAKNQRALMTQKLRNFIKQRDKFTCRFCKASIKEHKLLLLEVDHIIPISRGGLSTEDNLQTLCWKCNRTKSSKIYA